MHTRTYTHTHTHTHTMHATDFMDKSNFKEPGTLIVTSFLALNEERIW